MSGGHKFNAGHAARLNDPERLRVFVPEAMWAALDAHAPTAIVDIGAGAGLLTSAFARLAPEATLYAVDVSAEMLSYLTQHVAPDVAERIVPVLAEETRIPLPDGLADAVTMVALYHELDDPEATLREARRLLRPGGRLLIVDWSKERSEDGPPMEHRVSAEEIGAAVQSAGFTAVGTDDGLAGFSIVTATREDGA